MDRSASSPTLDSQPKARPWFYWALVIALVLFGMVAIFSIGAPFFLLGVTLAAVAPWRHRPTVLWPAIVGVLGFVAGFILTAPLACSVMVVPAPNFHPAQHCTTVLGMFHYNAFSPSLVPPLAVGLATAALTAAITNRVIARGRHEHKEPARGV